MSLIKSIMAQLGLSSTATQNFTITAAAADGTMKLARGNAGATTQDILNVDAAGNVNAPVGLQQGGVAVGRMQIIATKATTSGTSIVFSPADGTGVPSWTKRVTLSFNQVTNGAAASMLIQLGSGAMQTTGYVGGSSRFGASNANSSAAYTAGAGINSASASDAVCGQIVFVSQGNNVWTWSMSMGESGATGTYAYCGGGSVTLPGNLDRVQLTTPGGAGVFTAGSITLLCEG